MKVESLPYPGRAVCSGRGQTENLDVLMLGDVQIGEWVLAWNGMGTKKITEERRVRSMLRSMHWKRP